MVGPLISLEWGAAPAEGRLGVSGWPEALECRSLAGAAAAHALTDTRYISVSSEYTTPLEQYHNPSAETVAAGDTAKPGRPEPRGVSSKNPDQVTDTVSRPLVDSTLRAFKGFLAGP